MRVLLAVLAMAVVLFPLPARAIDVWGDQSGTWTKDNSPYNVIGEIRVPPESTLVIEPGVVVNFEGHYKFIVDNSATLLAVGTESDSIYFTTDYHYIGWHGIRFLSASSNSQITYCHLQYGKATGYGEDRRGGAIYCHCSSPTISNSIIIQNYAEERGGGIYCYDSDANITGNTVSCNSVSRHGLGYRGAGIYCEESNPVITSNTIEANHTSHNGGGICIWYCSGTPMIANNLIRNNSSVDGGGISLFECSATISINTITNNSANFGGGIHCQNYSNAQISGNTIRGNSANYSGGGIHTSNASPSISYNLICDNTAGIHGGGIGCHMYNYSMIVNNTISGNSANQSGGGLDCRDSDPTVVNTILWGNTAPSSPEINVWDGGRPTVTYSDVQSGWPGVGNIHDDPLFVDPGLGDFHLQWGSPCIDTGDPNSAPDPDGTRADMGALYFHKGLLFSPDAYAFNLLIESSAEKTLSLENVGADTAFFSLSTDVDWISFSSDSGYVPPDTALEVFVTFDGTDLSLGPNEATIYLEVVTSYGQLDHEMPVLVNVFSLEYTYVSLDPDSLPITIPPEGGSFRYWAQVYNSSSFLYRFDIWIDVTLPDGTTHGPRFKRESFRFRPGYSELRYPTQNVPACAPPGEYSYNFKMGVFPDQIDYQDSFTFTKLDVASLIGLAGVTSWDLYGWDDELVTHLRQSHDPKALGPTEYSLSQNYPNPFNATTTIKYQLPVEADVKLEVYNLFGQKVTTLVDSKQEAGYRSVNWDASSVSSGLYFYRLSAGDYTETRRMMLVK